MIHNLEWWEFSLAFLAVFLMGLGKGGLPGVGSLTVVIFTMVFEPKASVGLLLPILLSADVVAILIYRRHVEWRFLVQLLPWMMCGVLCGWLLFDHISSEGVRMTIGITVLAMTGLQILRKWGGALSQRMERMPRNPFFSITMGLAGGFATMMANAAGPIGQLYFLSMGLPKLSFIGTSAWTFFLINAFKVPFQAELGIINGGSIMVSGLLMPGAVLGCLLAPKLVGYINQEWFERLVWIFVVVAAIKMLLF